MSPKERITVTLDAELVDAARAAVAAGEADSISGWVNEGLADRLDSQQRARAFDEFLAAYEAEHGTITDAEMEQAERDLRARAVVTAEPHTPGKGVA